MVFEQLMHAGVPRAIRSFTKDDAKPRVNACGDVVRGNPSPGLSISAAWQRVLTGRLPGANSVVCDVVRNWL